MVADPSQREVKATARRIADLVDALYVPDQGAARAADPAALVSGKLAGRGCPVWGPDDLDAIAARLANGAVRAGV
jgi:hypothetical protein